MQEMQQEKKITKPRQKSLERQRSKEILEIGIARKTKVLLDAWLEVALGQVFIYRNVEGKNIRLTEQKDIDIAKGKLGVGGIDRTGEYFFITAKEPDANAIKEIFTRLHGKAGDGEDGQNSAKNFADVLYELAKRGLEIAKRKDAHVTDVQQVEGAVEKLIHKPHG